MHPFFQVLVVDLDERKALRRVGDENSILPNHLAKGVKNALQLAHSSEMHTNNLLACEAFTRLFVEAVGHYERYIISSGDDRNYVKSFQVVRGEYPPPFGNLSSWYVHSMTGT